MRDQIADALQAAIASGDKRRIATLRLVATALKDKEAAFREAGRGRPDAADMVSLLHCMLRHRQAAEEGFRAAGRLEEAEAERACMEMIRELMPAPVPTGEIEAACRQIVSDTGSKGLRDVGRCMSALKDRYQDKLNLIEAGVVMRGLLS
ncbi:GatB/YqeY domain-containing protein [Aureimonas flava]|uniref:GatB/YqeY domain-containing protein n=1 Tax=Aureimonas flava TaxID=2320271 RepID=A0A3A1WPK2_9HYPH|nr:GatB/YqeY domain-containing protein [Aureimonas flava]RIY02056.1 GatB/YqeY domain-containing protein [Aureimonas flava]